MITYKSWMMRSTVPSMVPSVFYITLANLRPVATSSPRLDILTVLLVWWWWCCRRASCSREGGFV